MRGDYIGGDSLQDNKVSKKQDPESLYADQVQFERIVNKAKSIVPVTPNGELEILLDTVINLAKLGLDTRSKEYQKFYEHGLTVLFMHILTYKSISDLEFEIHRSIMKNCERLVELCICKLEQGSISLRLLELLALVFDPDIKFHKFNGTRLSDTISSESQIPGEELYARPADVQNPQGWLVDLINLFGKLGGFSLLQERFQSGVAFTLPVITSLIRPFNLCYKLLTMQTIEIFFMPVVELLPSFLKNVTDELKKEENSKATIKNLEIFRLKMISRLLHVSSFKGKMNAMNEVNKVIANITDYSHKEEDWFTAKCMVEWIKENSILRIILQDSLHQPEYVEKLEKIIRFIIKEKALRLEDLDDVWAAQAGKHEAIVENIYDLLAKLACDFIPEELDHLFKHFQASWKNASEKQREKLLELIQRFFEDDKVGARDEKVLNLLWNLAYGNDVYTEMSDQAMMMHVKILDSSFAQDPHSEKRKWVVRCVDQLQSDMWVLPTLRHIYEILQSCPEGSLDDMPQCRCAVIRELENHHTLISTVLYNLTTYINRAHTIAKENPDLDPNAVSSDSRFSHVNQVQERLNFIRFLLEDSKTFLKLHEARWAWILLAKHGVYVTDRDICFQWFLKLMCELGLQPEITIKFFEKTVLQLDPSLLTENGMRCFDHYFTIVNAAEDKLLLAGETYFMNNLGLIGMDYLWRVVLCDEEDVANQAIELLKRTYTNLGPLLLVNKLDVRKDFVQSCMGILKVTYDTISVLEHNEANVKKLWQEIKKITRVLRVLREYVVQYDGDWSEGQSVVPMARWAIQDVV